MRIKRIGRGRPLGSEARQNIIEILFFMKEGCGNEIHKIYCDLFNTISKVTVYYHLKKGAELRIFDVSRKVTETGNFSWGGTSEKIYYSLGPEATPKLDNRVKDYFDKRCKK